MKKRINSACIVFMLAFLWLPFLSMTTQAEELPGDGKAVDGTIRSVDSQEISKGEEIVSAPNLPGDQNDSQNAGETKTPDVSSEDSSFSKTGSSPVITCGAGQKTEPPAVEEEPEPPTTQWVSLGTFSTTGYCNCEQCSSGFSLTYSGTVPRANHTISADLSLFPLGTQLMINGIVYTVEDMGSGVVGRTLDIYYDKHENAVAHGRQFQEVLIIA